MLPEEPTIPTPIPIPTPILSLDHITKQFGNAKAVDEVTFAIPKQSIFGLLGPNGAGKTTLIRIITNILAPDSGQVLFDGKPFLKGHRWLIGYMPEERGLYRKMKVGEHLVYLARLRDLSKQEAKERIDRWMQKFDITSWWNKKISELSKGMQQKIQFIATIIHEPQLLILDEPFSGLDPINTNLIKQEIQLLREKGTTIIFSTHRMEQVEEICDHIVLINHGKQVLQGKVSQLKQDFKRNEYQVQTAKPIPKMTNRQYDILRQSEQEMVLQLHESYSSDQLLRSLLDQGITITAFHELLPSLNEIFISQVENANHD